MQRCGSVSVLRDHPGHWLRRDSEDRRLGGSGEGRGRLEGWLLEAEGPGRRQSRKCQDQGLNFILIFTPPWPSKMFGTPEALIYLLNEQIRLHKNPRKQSKMSMEAVRKEQGERHVRGLVTIWRESMKKGSAQPWSVCPTLVFSGSGAIHRDWEWQKGSGVAQRYVCTDNMGFGVWDIDSISW